MKYLLFLLIIGVLAKANAQDKDYALRMVNELCKPEFRGRGYVQNGDFLASQFIAKEFKNIGLDAITKDFVQKFSHSVNTFPGNMQLAFDGVPKVPAVDYLVDTECPTLNVKTGIFLIANEDLNDSSFKIFLKDKTKSFQGKVLILDTLQGNPTNTYLENRKFILQQDALKKYKIAAIVLLQKQKLAWSVGNKQNKVAVIYLNYESFSKDSKTIDIDIQAKFIKKYKSSNVVGMVKGWSQKDSFIILSAHYDHLGSMGTATYFPGANDNASGIALLLDLARYYVANPPKYNILFIAFGAEEAGLVGSHYYATKKPLRPLAKVRFVLNLDLMASGDKGMMVVNGSIYKEEMRFLQDINEEKQYFLQIYSRGKAANSDHYFFSEKGVRSFFIYLLGDYKWYHEPNDKAANVSFPKYNETFWLIRDFLFKIQ